MSTDPYDAVLDARSEARYTDDLSAEPEQWEVDAARYAERYAPVFECYVDESAGFRG